MIVRALDKNGKEIKVYTKPVLFTEDERLYEALLFTPGKYGKYLSTENPIVNDVIFILKLHGYQVITPELPEPKFPPGARY